MLLLESLFERDFLPFLILNSQILLALNISLLQVLLSLFSSLLLLCLLASILLFFDFHLYNPSFFLLSKCFLPNFFINSLLTGSFGFATSQLLHPGSQSSLFSLLLLGLDQLISGFLGLLLFFDPLDLGLVTSFSFLLLLEVRLVFDLNFLHLHFVVDHLLDFFLLLLFDLPNGFHLLLEHRVLVSAAGDTWRAHVRLTNRVAADHRPVSGRNTGELGRASIDRRHGRPHHHGGV